jgi:hypothetical protein
MFLNRWWEDRRLCMPDYDGGVGTGTSGMGGTTDNSNNNSRSLSNIGPAKEETIDLGPQANSDESSLGHRSSDGTQIGTLDVKDGFTEQSSSSFFDTHYTLNGKKFGFEDEIAADVLDELGIHVNSLNLDIVEGLASIAFGIAFGVPAISLATKGLSVVGNIAQEEGAISAQQNRDIQAFSTVADFAEIAYGGMQSMSLGIDALDAGYTGIGVAELSAAAISGYFGYQAMEEQMSSLGFSASSSPADIGFSDVDGGDGNGLISSLIKKANNNLVQQKRLRDSYYADISTGDIFNKMAGGLIYQGIFAGGEFYDATTPANTNISVGEIFSMSSFSKSINAPYNYLLPKNQAGTIGYSVV